MAKHKRKPVKGKPITSHQLFPAVVALWFGALFGLGSLAVRPSLLEGLVLKSQLDLLIPAAAPPLGVTARILVALILAALGAMLGLMIARRIARPKPVVTERKRKGRDLGREESAARPRYSEASTRPPVLARGEFADELQNSGGGGVLANRRRSLAIEHEESEFVPHDAAPLPGGNPQIFDIAELGITDVQSPPEPEPVAFAEATEPVAPVAALATCEVSAAAHADGRQVFGMSQPEPQPEAARQIFGVAAMGDHVPQDFVKAAGYQTTVFELEQAEPLFAPRDPESPVSEPATAPLPEPVAVPVPQAFEPNVAQVQDPIAPTPLAVKPESPLIPASLGLGDLAARLGESMRRRRTARAEAPAQAAAVEPATPAVAPAAFAAQALAAFEAPAAPVVTEPAPTAAAPIPAAYEPQAPEAAPIPSAYEPPAFEAGSVLELTPALEPVPSAFAPPQSQFAAPQPAPAAAVLPRAMQPLALDAFLEEDAHTDPSLLPPRHIVMPVAPTQVSVPEAVQPELDPPAPVVDAEVTEEEAPAEDGYASLLEVAPARNPFVRIEEAESVQAEIEPVVIFPGQAPAQVAAFAEVPEAAPFRRFDAPGNAEQGQLVAANLAAPSLDPGEADQALRAALSNLQRMSGAA